MSKNKLAKGTAIPERCKKVKKLFAILLLTWIWMCPDGHECYESDIEPFSGMAVSESRWRPIEDQEEWRDVQWTGVLAHFRICGKHLIAQTRYIKAKP